MAKATRKRMTKEELNAPDEIEVALSNFWGKVAKYKNPIFIGVGALVVLGIVLGIVGMSSKKSADERGDALRTVVGPLAAYVGEVNPQIAALPGPKPEQYADEAARDAEAKKRLEAWVAERGSEDARELVDLALAQEKLAGGDAAGAAEAAKAWVAQYPESAAKLAGLELAARALTAKGEKDAAVAAWKALAAAATGELKADALRQAGDLQNPVFGGAGDAAQAKSAYDEALAALGPAPEAPAFQLAPAGLRGEIQNRLDLLPQ